MEIADKFTSALEQPQERQDTLENYITQLPDKIQKAQYSQICTIEAKYHSLLMTMKPFRDLAQKHKKQLNQFIRELQQDYRIDRLSSESDYYRSHVEYLEKLNSNFDKELLKKKELEAQMNAVTLERRKTLGALKLENIELMMAIEKKKSLFRGSEVKQIIEEKEIMQISEQCGIAQERAEAEQELLETEKQLLQKISSMASISQSIWSVFQQLRTDLQKNQKVVHNQGLAGSMLFKLTSAQNKQNNPVAKLPSHRRRMDGDLKFLVYDSLKRKYENVKKEEAKRSEKYEVSLNKFGGYSCLQVAGLMELRSDSLKTLQQQLLDRRRKLISKYTEY